jgi:hypothetical protein
MIKKILDKIFLYRKQYFITKKEYELEKNQMLKTISEINHDLDIVAQYVLQIIEVIKADNNSGKTEMKFPKLEIEKQSENSNKKTN